MKSSVKFKTILLAAIATVFVVIPATASAHPSVFTDTARIVPDASWTYGGPGVGLGTQTRYVVNNHGYPYVLRESNGKTTGGVLNYMDLPSRAAGQPSSAPSYRASLVAAEGIDALLSEGDTGAQAHATCSAAVLNTEAAITGWQGAEPFFNYIPFQGTAVGIDDEGSVAEWTADVLTLTGVNLANITDTTFAEDGPLDTACEGLGGNLIPPDATQTSVSAFPSATLAAAVAPLNTQIGDLTAEKDQLTTDKATLEAEKSTLQGEKNTLLATIATVTGQKDGLAGEVSKLKTDLAKSQAAKQKADKQIKSLKKQVSKLKKQLKRR